MANTANVGFFGPNNPSIQAQQQQLAISKALAEQLTKAGSEQSQTEFAGGLAVPQSSTVGAGKMAQMLAGAYINRKSQDKANDLATNSYNSMAGMYGAPQYPAASEDHGTILSRMLGMSDAPAAADGTPVGQAQTIPTAIPGQPSPQELASAMGAPASPNAQAPQATPEPQTPFKLNGFSGQDSMMLAQTSPEAYAKILENQHHMTDKMIERASMGITPAQSRTMEMAPLAGQLGPNGNVTMDAQGNPTIASVPGAAGVITANKRAEAAGTLGKQNMTMPDGSVRTDVPVFGNGEILKPIDTTQPVPAQYRPGAPVVNGDAPPATKNQMLADMNGGNPPIATPPVSNLSNVPPQPASFGSDPAAMKKAETDAGTSGTNIAEAAKTANIMQSNLPMVLQRFQDMREASDQAGYGAGNDETGNGFMQNFHKNFTGDPTGKANAVLAQRSAQGILPELGPQLAQAGIKGNKFLETIASNASGLDLAATPDAKKEIINGLEKTYIGNLKSTAAQLRANGQQAPTDAEIDAMVAQHKGGAIKSAPAISEGSTATNPATGKKLTFRNGQWQ